MPLDLLERLLHRLEHGLGVAEEVVAVLFQRRPRQGRERVAELRLAVGELRALQGVGPDRRLPLRLGPGDGLDQRLAIAHPEDEDDHAPSAAPAHEREKRRRACRRVSAVSVTRQVTGVQALTKISLINNLPENALAGTWTGR